MIGGFQLPVVGGVETAGGGGLVGCAVRRSYQWGLDVSGTRDGPGGVGGLLAVQRHGTTGMTTTRTGTFLPCYDGNGNVTELVSWGSPGVVSARYEYGPFGETVVMEGDAIAGENPIRFSTKVTDGETGLVYYGYRYYSPEMGRWVSRDPIGERGGINLYRFCYNDIINWVDYLGWIPVNGGVSVPNGTSPTANGQNEHFDEVARDGSDKGRNQRTNSGQEILDFLQELSKNSCCIKELTVAGHGWDSVQGDGVTPAGHGPGLPGVAPGSGLYENGPNGDRWATDPNARRLSDLETDIAGGKTTFCKPCEVRIHACNISPGFAEKLGSITKCKVTFGRGACSGRRPWKSGVGKEQFDNNAGNGFWQSDGGLPSTPISNSYRP